MDENKIERSNKVLKWLNYSFGVVFMAIGAAFLVMLIFSEQDHPLLDRRLSLIVAAVIFGYGILKIRMTYSKYKS